MRVNLPVTQKEHLYNAGHSLVSVTDLKGRITYCNDAFVAVSGYTREELLGQAHNIIRHPDMPEEAFRDMWHTLQSGQPWTGLVKNRRKNGDHYWVLANATPMKDGERTTGDLSVRICHERDTVESAEKLYQTMRDEARHGALQTVLARGVVVRKQALARLAAGLTPGLRDRLWAIQLGAIGLGMLAAVTLPPGISWLPALLLAGAAVAAIQALTLQPLHLIVADASRLAAGDLSHPVRLGHEGLIGDVQRALNQLAVNLRTVEANTRDEILEVRQAVAEISAGNMDLSARTEAQAASLEQTAASMKQINDAIGQTAESARHGTTLAESTSAIAVRSHHAVEQVGHSMETINDSSHRIGEIIHVVESVAFQTNILALNAAVEAAHAGEAGRVATGNAHSSQAQANMSEALQSVQNVNNLLNEISSAATEQQSSISQISQAKDHMDGITQQNAAMVKELASNAKSLLTQVEAVSNSMRLFRLKRGEPSIAEVDAVALRITGKEHQTGAHGHQD